jgi:adenosine deaminase
MSDLRGDLDDDAFVAAMPKVELHVHIEGTIEPDSLFEIAERNGIDLPYDTAEGVAAYQAEQRASGRENLVNFLDCLDVSRGALRTPEDYHKITTSFLSRCQREGVRYVEIMFDPQQAIRQGVSLGDCIDALSQGQQDGARSNDVRSQLIMCFQRDHPPDEALTLLEQADTHRDAIVGIGLDNYETPGFPAIFQPVFDAARDRGYRLTSHCDVNQPDSVSHIRRCVQDLGVERIDHGLNAVDDPALMDLVLEHDIALTGCPTYYADASSSVPARLEMHRTLLDAGVRISLNTDDPAQFGSGWLTNTIRSALVAAPFTRRDIVRFMDNAISSAWTDESHRQDLTAELRAFEGSSVSG